MCLEPFGKLVVEARPQRVEPAHQVLRGRRETAGPACGAAARGLYEPGSQALLHFVEALPGRAVRHSEFAGGGDERAMSRDSLKEAHPPVGKSDAPILSLKPYLQPCVHSAASVAALAEAALLGAFV